MNIMCRLWLYVYSIPKLCTIQPWCQSRIKYPFNHVMIDHKSLYFEVSTTYLPAILPSCMSSYTLFNSLNPHVLYGALIKPRLKNSMASAESRLLPTYEPLIVIILMTDSKTGARRYAPAGRPMATTVPRGRTYY